MMAWLRRTIAAIVLICFSCVAFADPPPQAGVVFRGEGIPFFNWWYDEEADVSVYFGVDPLLACTEPFPSGWELVPIMDVLMDTDGEDVFRYRRHINAELQTSVWQGFVPPGPFPFSLCPRILFDGLTPIANGYSRYKLNDNDVEPDLNEDRHNVNSFGFNANGVLLYYDTGEPARFLMYFHGAWDGIDFDSFRSIMRTRLR